MAKAGGHARWPPYLAMGPEDLELIGAWTARACPARRARVAGAVSIGLLLLHGS